MEWKRFESVVTVAIVVILVVTFVASIGLLATTQFHHVPHADEKALVLGVALVFACVVLLFLSRLVRSLDDGEHFGVESHWGGLGGGVGGWRITRPLALLLLVVTFAALMAVLLSRYADRARGYGGGDNTATTDTATTDTATTNKTTTTDTTATTGTTATTEQTATGQTATAPASTDTSASQSVTTPTAKGQM